MRRKANAVPDGYLVIKSPPRGDNEIPKMRALPAAYLEYEKSRVLLDKVKTSKKGYVTLKEAYRALGLSRVIDPNGVYTPSVERLVEQHPLDLIIVGKRVYENTVV